MQVESVWGKESFWQEGAQEPVGNLGMVAGLAGSSRHRHVIYKKLHRRTGQGQVRYKAHINKRKGISRQVVEKQRGMARRVKKAWAGRRAEPGSEEENLGEVGREEGRENELSVLSHCLLSCPVLSLARLALSARLPVCPVPVCPSSPVCPVTPMSHLSCHCPPSKTVHQTGRLGGGNGRQGKEGRRKGRWW